MMNNRPGYRKSLQLGLATSVRKPVGILRYKPRYSVMYIRASRIPTDPMKMGR